MLKLTELRVHHRAMPQVVILRPLFSEARIRSEFSPWKFCGEQSRKGTIF